MIGTSWKQVSHDEEEEVVAKLKKAIPPKFITGPPI